MPNDLYTLLSQTPPVMTVESSRFPGDPKPDRPRPGTQYTASIETVDNDHAGMLLGRISL